MAAMTDDAVPTPPDEASGTALDADQSGSPEPGAPAAVFAAADRPRGLDSWFAPGGEDDASPERRADERRMLRLLLLMVVLLVAIPTVLTVIAFVGQLMASQGGGG